MTQKEQIKKWMTNSTKRFFPTSEIIKFGSTIFCNTADRLARELGSKGFIRRLTKDEIEQLGLSTKQGYWKLVKPAPTKLFDDLYSPK